jgi:putative DNA primase/helicase
MNENEFYNAVTAQGFNCGKVVADGKFHRFDVVKGDKAGYYKLTPDGFGVYGNWKTGEQFKFFAGRTENLTEKERQDLKAAYKAQQRAAKEKIENDNAKAANEARRIWDAANEATSHPYLEKKQIAPHGLKIDDKGNLLIPIYEGEKLVNLQRIDKNGKKLFVYGAKKRGCYSLIAGTQGVIFICEGFATGASVNEATGAMCIVALDAGNLLPVAKAIRNKYGLGQKIIIAADNDQWTVIKDETINVGIKAANETSYAIGCEVKFPKFHNDDADKRTDWNDWASGFGLQSVKDELMPHETALMVAEKKSMPDIMPELILNENGKPKCIIDNLKNLCDMHGIILRYNVIKKSEEILIPNEFYSLDNSLNASYAHVLSLCEINDMSTKHIGDYMTNIADKTPYNPVATWIESAPWDGVSRLDEFYATVKCTNEPLRDIILKKWMISAIAAAFSPYGISAHGVLVFQGQQYLGKTSWFKSLVPKELEAIKDGYILRLDDKDSVFQCLSHWMVELGELEATFKKSDIAQLKAFITSDKDILRRPYARKESVYPRRTIFFASVNQKEFLFDETGNRRFWAIEALALNYNHGLNMQQIWAEFKVLYDCGENWIMSFEENELINTSNEEFTGADFHDELVASKFNWNDYSMFDDVWKTVTEVALFLGIQNPKQQDLNRVAKAVKKYNGDKSKRGAGGVRLVCVPWRD